MIKACAIIQLCLAFSCIIWVWAQPFTGDYFTTRSALLLFQTATGQGNSFISPEKLKRHAVRFAKLEPKRRQQLLEAYTELERRAQRPALTKLGESFKALLIDLPPFTQAWLLFSITIAILLLRGVEGAVAASWLLPVITLCCVFDNPRFSAIASVDEVQLPSEEVFLKQYLEEPLGSSLAEQKAGWTRAWQRYLIEVWADETPSSDPEEWAMQVESGEYALTVARIEKGGGGVIAISPSKQITWPLLWLYLFWNTLFAMLVNRSQHSRAYVQ